MQQEDIDFNKILTELVQQHMVIFGPNIALDLAKKTLGLELDNSGSVTKITGDPKLVLKHLIAEYQNLAGPVSKMAVNELSKKFPFLNQF